MRIVNYGVSKHYAGSMVSDHCPLGYLFAYAVIGHTRAENDSCENLDNFSLIRLLYMHG